MSRLPRRAALAAPAVLALAPASAAGAAHPDVELVASCDAFIIFARGREAASQAADDLPPGPERDSAWAEIKDGTARYHAMLAAIMEREARSEAGIRAKARAYLVHIGDEPSTDEGLPHSIAHDLLRLIPAG